MKIPKPRRKNEQGEWLCRWCDKPCTGRRSSWCSNECRDAGSVAYLPLREQAHARDEGICQSCGRDTKALEEHIRGMIRRVDREATDEDDLVRRERVRRRLLKAVRELEEEGYKKCFRVHRPHAIAGGWTYARVQIRQALWEADHILPKIFGGKDTLENLRTLCVPCHKEVTARLSAERARRRKSGREWEPARWRP